MNNASKKIYVRSFSNGKINSDVEKKKVSRCDIVHNIVFSIEHFICSRTIYAVVEHLYLCKMAHDWFIEQWGACQSFTLSPSVTAQRSSGLRRCE